MYGEFGKHILSSYSQVWQHWYLKYALNTAQAFCKYNGAFFLAFDGMATSCYESGHVRF